MRQPRFEPLVVGAPRSGFALLSSVLMHFLPWVRHELDLHQQVLNILLTGVGDHITRRIVAVFARHGIETDLLFNPNFRYLVGGPKWIPKDRPDRACFRKYIGVRGKGDFTLVTAHPRQVLNLDPIVHSHTDPQLWVTHPGYSSYTRFASIRSPVDILNSSVFSLNALASEYIQKFIPPELDNDTIRQDLALYKFTDLDFFEGLLRHLIGYFDEFMAVRDRYIVMRWEDLIEAPVPSIVRLAQEGGVPMREDVAAGIWQKLDHVNLTQAHKHNFRAGHGVVGGWKNWITNHHLRLIQEYGFEKHMIALGYGEIEWLDESRYTDFQRKVSGCIASGRVHRDFFDPDLFTFAFNKSTTWCPTSSRSSGMVGANIRRSSARFSPTALSNRRSGTVRNLPAGRSTPWSGTSLSKVRTSADAAWRSCSHNLSANTRQIWDKFRETATAVPSNRHGD